MRYTGNNRDKFPVHGIAKEREISLYYSIRLILEDLGEKLDELRNVKYVGKNDRWAIPFLVGVKLSTSEE